MVLLLRNMRETKFIEQNREKWAEFEEMLRQNHRDPEKLNDLFIQIMDDLSYARTFYPNRSVRMYLNGLAQRVFHNVYRGKRLPLARFRLFWTDELPQLMWESRQALLLSFSIFALACLIGVVSSMIDTDFARVILGDDYVTMTLGNIEKGDPMAVYKQSQPLGMSFGIAVNNIFVALRTAILGVLASIGTVFILMYNGIMLGAFQYFFFEKGLLWQSALTIWIHGTLEISAIVISGAAGMVMGSGLLFPGTYTRGQAFRLSVRKGMKIFFGLIPMFLLAAFFEGFLTRYTDTPAVVRALFILCSLAFVLWYFVWLPWHKARVGFTRALEQKELPPVRHQPVDFTGIKSAGEILSDVFTLLIRQARLIWVSLAATSAVYLGLMLAFSGQPLTESFVIPDLPTGSFQGWWEMLDLEKFPVLFWGQAFLFFILTQVAFRVVAREMPPAQRDTWRRHFFGIHQLVALAVPLIALWFLEAVQSGFFLWLAGMAVFPLLGGWVASAHYEGSSLRSFPRAWSLLRWGQGTLFGFLVINMALLLFLFFDSGFWTEIALPFFSWLVPAQEEYVQTYMVATTAFLVNFVAQLVWMMLLLGGSLTYFSTREATDAVLLREGIEQIGAGRQIRGLAREAIE